MKKPTEVEVITYQVGFGDCFLVRVHYDKGRPHTMLIDFGSTRKERYSLTQISKVIAKDCEKGLDVVVATHRHKDHVGGFTRTKTLKGTGKVIRDLKPKVVIMPWTEDPKAQPNAIKPTKRYGSQGPALAARLMSMQALAGSIDDYSKLLRFHGERSLRASLHALGENNLANKSAMKNLRSLGRRHYYAYHGMKLALKRELPGVKVHVLGPPDAQADDDHREAAQQGRGRILAPAGPRRHSAGRASGALPRLQDREESGLGPLGQAPVPPLARRAAALDRALARPPDEQHEPDPPPGDRRQAPALSGRRPVRELDVRPSPSPGSRSCSRASTSTRSATTEA